MSCLPRARYSCSHVIEALPDSSREFAQPGIQGTGPIRTESRRIEYIDTGPVIFLDGDDVQRDKREEGWLHHERLQKQKRASDRKNAAWGKFHTQRGAYAGGNVRFGYDRQSSGFE